MPQTRSRPKTEQKFQDAVLSLVAEEGCATLGVNRIAQRAGADKVLIYRYFGGLDGLLEQVARSREWLPSAEALVCGANLSGTGITDPADVLRRISCQLVKTIRSEPTTRQLVGWRKATRNPLTNYFTSEWQGLWRELPGVLSSGLDSAQGRGWKEACDLTALLIETEVCGEAAETDCFERLAADLEWTASARIAAAGAPVEDDSLPTNLL